jgi:primosomal protein N' (replication factor Y)
VLCRSCGTVIACPHCDIPMVFHQDRSRLICHRCNHREQPRRECGSCGGGMNYFGAGTQRVEEEVKRIFPSARVLRWDQDSVRRQGGHDRLLRRIEGREVDIVVGTQMIAKGLDLPMITAIGVIHADTMLHLPDFRSGERTFQLLTQVAGRAGRRTAGSRVVIQSYTPNHYAIQAASRHDYPGFFEEELAFRREHRYPPFSRLARFAFRHQKEEVCAAEAEEMARRLARHARELEVKADLIGPTPAFASKVRGKHQWQVVLRAHPDEFDRLLDDLPSRPGWLVDVDPQSLL